jgi:hypothetical protein
MVDVGKAINNTFHSNVAATGNVSGSCALGMAELVLQGAPQFDFVMSMEDLRLGQRIANYSVDFRRVGSSAWEPLVPPSNLSAYGDRPDGHGGSAPATRGGPHIHTPQRHPITRLLPLHCVADPRDSFIGHKRIDFPGAGRMGDAQHGCALWYADARCRCWAVIAASGAAAVPVAAVRFNCLAALEEPVYLRSFSLHRKVVPWEPSDHA